MKTNGYTYLVNALVKALLIMPLFSFLGTVRSNEIITCQTTYDEAVSLERSNVMEALNRYFIIWHSCDDVVLINRSYINACKLAQTYNSPSHFPDKCQLYGQGIVNVDFLIRHISWLSYLDSVSTAAIGQREHKTRMELALTSLAENIEKRGLRPANCESEEDLDYEQLFEEFKNCDAKYFTRPSIDLWLKLIVRYEADDKWINRSWSEWVRFVETNPIQGEHHWLELRVKLEEWMDSENGKSLSTTARQVYRQKLQTIVRVVG